MINNRVIEFNKDAKRILLSHTDIWKEQERAQNADQEDKRKKRASKTSQYVNKINKAAEASTFGELDVLADLKAKMEGGDSAEKAPKAKKEAAPKEEKPKKEEAPKATKKAEKKESEEASADDEAAQSKELFAIIGEASEADKDDLKKINGIGPVYEKKLNSIGSKINLRFRVVMISDSGEQLHQDPKQTIQIIGNSPEC